MKVKKRAAKCAALFLVVIMTYCSVAPYAAATAVPPNIALSAAGTALDLLGPVGDVITYGINSLLNGITYGVLKIFQVLFLGGNGYPSVVGFLISLPFKILGFVLTLPFRLLGDTDSQKPHIQPPPAMELNEPMPLPVFA